MKQVLVLCVALFLVAAVAFADGGNGSNGGSTDKRRVLESQGAGSN